MIEAAPAPRLDTRVTDAETGEQLHRTDYAGTVWYGGRPQVMAGGVVSTGGVAQISTPFVLPDSHRYARDALTEAHVQVTAAVLSSSDSAQLLDGGTHPPREPMAPYARASPSPT